MLLLDTPALVWFAASPGRLPRPLIERLESTEDVFVSEASPWELTIKAATRRGAPAIDLEAAMARGRFKPLGIAFGVHRQLAGLPAIHGDPFDRLLIAQALHEGLSLVSDDDFVRRYPVPVIWH